jgi:hypothetical protein
MRNFTNTKFESITIEPGSHGETYHREGGFTVYGHSTYGEGSVLEGQDMRCFLDYFDTLEEAQNAFPTAEVIEGSTYQQIHIPHSAPDWFDPDIAGEVWDDEDGFFEDTNFDSCDLKYEY